MKDYLKNKNKYYSEFANSIYDKYLNIKYGISSCHRSKDPDLVSIRKELADWQSNHDHGALSERVRINYLTWLPVKVFTPENEGGAGYCVNEPIGPTSAALQYTYGNVSQNIIEVNAGGCITRINVNPTINLNTNTGAISYTQTIPATVWTIIHGLGFTPNVLVTDLNHSEIEGMVTPIDSNTITITFSAPTSGIAYLS